MPWAGKVAEFSPCERMFICQSKLEGQVSTSPLPLLEDRKLGLELIGRGFHGRPAGGPLPEPLHELGKLSPASFNWQMNILSQVDNSAALPALLIAHPVQIVWKV